ncbi:MAG: acyl-CoA dehydrogenase family protein [Pseudomonadota bacterium]
MRADTRLESYPELETAGQVVQAIRDGQGRMDERAGLRPELATHLKQQGLFRLLLPAEFGGSELSLPRYIRVVEMIAQADGSAGWCVGQGGVFPNLADRMTEEAASDIWRANPDAVVATGSPTGSTALETADGFRMNGRWRFASGIMHADWLAAMAPTVNDAGDTTGFGMFLVPRDDVVLGDGWNVRGLRGTASRDYQLQDYVVPRYRSMRGPVLRTHCGIATGLPAMLLFASAFGSVGLGIARRAIDELYNVVEGKTPFSTSRALRDDDMVHVGVAQAEAMWGSARAYLREMAETCEYDHRRSGEVAQAARARLRLAATNAMREAGRAVDKVYELAGSDVIFDDHPIHRCFQDVRALTQQIQARPAHFRTVGRVLMGLDPDNPMV